MATVVQTITFNEGSKGWTSFWDYQPSFAFSINGRYFTTKDGSLYEHYTSALNSYFYDTYYPSKVTLSLNEFPSSPKNYLTLGYEGSNGWEVTSIETDEFSPSSNDYGNVSITDRGVAIESYSEGLYIENGVEYRSGFDRRENKYYADIKGDGVSQREGEILLSDETSGIKGVFCLVTLETDQTTNTGGVKQLFAVSSEFVQSS